MKEQEKTYCLFHLDTKKLDNLSEEEKEDILNNCPWPKLKDSLERKGYIISTTGNFYGNIPDCVKVGGHSMEDIIENFYSITIKIGLPYTDSRV